MMCQTLSADDRAERALDVLRRSVDMDYIGEPISQLEHALQAAALAVKARQSDTVVLASLFHDIGHLLDTNAPQMKGLGVIDHEHVGGKFLKRLGFSSGLAHLVAAHVDAKRYLCYRKFGYLDRLSDASRQTLDWQGGPMDHIEASAFEADPWFETILGIRIYDERAKVAGADVPPLEFYRPMVLRHLLETGEKRHDAQLSA